VVIELISPDRLNPYLTALAARAEVALQLVDGETGLATVDLLEPPR
jgi:hypothetical protein